MKKLFSILMLAPILMWADVLVVTPIATPIVVAPPVPVIQIPLYQQYLGMAVGTDYCFLTNSSNSGLKVGIKAGLIYGYYFESGFRGELEVSFRKNSFRTKYNAKKDDLIISKVYRSMHSWTYMANLLYDINRLTYRTIVPYVGIGIGYCQFTDKNKYKSDTEVNVEKEKDDRFVYQGIVGARYSINPEVEAGIQYQYFCGQSHAKNHSITLSMIRNF
jgi:opacity protein-like surface antigen